MIGFDYKYFRRQLRPTIMAFENDQSTKLHPKKIKTFLYLILDQNIFQLVAMKRGYFNTTVKDDLYQGLDCPVKQTNLAASNNFRTFINLEEDPYLWHKLTWCYFPGSKAFQLTSQVPIVNSYSTLLVLH